MYINTVYYYCYYYCCCRETLQDTLYSQSVHCIKEGNGGLAVHRKPKLSQCREHWSESKCRYSCVFSIVRLYAIVSTFTICTFIDHFVQVVQSVRCACVCVCVCCVPGRIQRYIKGFMPQPKLSCIVSQRDRQQVRRVPWITTFFY